MLALPQYGKCAAAIALLLKRAYELEREVPTIQGAVRPGEFG
jgi:hypothetical protein